MDSLDARPIAGTEGANPFPLFWSPDSRFIGFAAEGKYKRVDLSGGPTQTLCELSGLLGSGSWNNRGVILVNSDNTGLFQVPQTGGTPVPVTAVDAARQETFHARPVFLSDGRHFLYLRLSSNPEYTGTYIGSLDTRPEEQERRRLLPGQFGVTYISSSDPAIGYVLFVQEATLMAQTFDNHRLELTGQPAPIAEQVGNNGTMTAFFSVSPNGALAYRSGGGRGLQYAWLDHQGKDLGHAGDPAQYNDLALSPDGTRVASYRQEMQRDIWLYEFARGVSIRFTFTPFIERFPVWSPGGSHIAFSSDRNGHYDLYQKASNGAGEDELLLKSNPVSFVMLESWLKRLERAAGGSRRGRRRSARGRLVVADISTF